MTHQTLYAEHSRPFLLTPGLVQGINELTELHRELQTAKSELSRNSDMLHVAYQEIEDLKEAKTKRAPSVEYYPTKKLENGKYVLENEEDYAKVCTKDELTAKRTTETYGMGDPKLMVKKKAGGPNENVDRTHRDYVCGCEVLVPSIPGRASSDKVQCGRKAPLMRGTRRICGSHNKTADAHMLKYDGWKEEYGTHNGWIGEVWQERVKSHSIRSDYRRPRRVKKKNQKLDYKLQNDKFCTNTRPVYEGADRCCANKWNGGLGQRCGLAGDGDLVPNHRGELVSVCKTHRNAIENALFKFNDWREEWGSIVGWYDDENWRERHDASCKDFTDEWRNGKEARKATYGRKSKKNQKLDYKLQNDKFCTNTRPVYEGADRCCANKWNGGLGQRCGLAGDGDLVPNHRGELVSVCKTHRNAIENALFKFNDWREEWGSIVGWYDDENWRERHDASCKDFTDEWRNGKEARKATYGRKSKKNWTSTYSTVDRCCGNLWNGGKGAQCTSKGLYMATNHEGKEVPVCKIHSNGIAGALAKYEGWNAKWGTINGWHDDENWRIRHREWSNRRERYTEKYLSENTYRRIPIGE